MRKRLAAVALVYATRRLLWAWGAVYLVVVGFGWWLGGRTEDSPIVVAPISAPRWKMWDRRDELERALADHREEEVVAINCRKDWDDFGSALEAQRIGAQQGGDATQKLLDEIRKREPLPPFDRFPRLRVLDLTGCVIFPEDAERIARCHALEWISLELAVVVDRDFNFLSGLRNVKTLILRTIQSAPSMPVRLEATTLPELQTLAVESSLWEKPQVLRALAGSPKLHDLVLRESRPDAIDRELIAAIPSLRRLFVGASAEDAARLAEWRGAFPQLTVWHGVLSWQRAHGTILMALAMALLVTVPLIHLRETFATSAVRLTPEFLLPHLLAPALVLGTGIVLQTVIAHSYGIAILPGLALQLFCLSVCCGPPAPTEWRRRDPAATNSAENAASTKRRWRDVPFRSWMGLATSGFIAGSIWLLVSRGYLLESLLLGEFPAWSAGLCLASAGLLALFVRDVPFVVVAKNESGTQSAGLSGTDSPSGDAVIAYGQESPMMIESLKRPDHPATWPWRVRAVRAVNMQTFAGLLNQSLWMVGFLVLADLIGTYVIGSVRASNTPLWWFVFAPIVEVIGMWGRRQDCFAADILRPWSRSEMTMAVFLGSVVDGIAVLVVPCACIPLANYWWVWDLTLAGMLMALVAILAAGALIWSAFLSLLTILHSLWALLIGFVGLLVMVVAVPLLANYFVGIGQVGTRMADFLFCITIECVAVTPILLRVAYRRWMSTEWGLITSK